jgi:hypothetical protein
LQVSAYLAFALGSADAVDRATNGLAAAGHPVIDPPQRSPDGCYRSVVLDPGGTASSSPSRATPPDHETATPDGGARTDRHRTPVAHGGSPLRRSA